MSLSIRCSGVGLDFPRSAGRDRHVLADLDFELPHEQFLAIVGPSGCGKTSLLRLIAGLIEPTRGSLDRPRRADGLTECAFVFQEADLVPWLSVADNVSLGRARLESARQGEGALETLQRVGLGEWADAYPRELSLGMQRRVSLARAFASEADLVLLDEPFAALDAQTRWRLQEELESFWREQPRTVVFVTHDVGEAVWLADRVVVLSGRPARVSRSFEVGFSRPRLSELRWADAFRDLEHEIWGALPEVEIERSGAGGGS